MAHIGVVRGRWPRAGASRLAALVAALLFPPLNASAHAPPQVIDVVAREGSGPILLTNRGLILADSPSGPFRLLCTEATRTNTTEKPDLIVTPDGALILATARGLIRSVDAGCSFEPIEPFGDVLVPAAAADPTDAAHFYVAAFDPTRGGLFETHDGGASFERLQPASETDFVATLLVAPSRPERIYLDGQLIGEDTITWYAAVSDDGGASFERFELALEPTESSFELLAVSPTDPDLIVGRAADADPVALQDRLLVSRDRGETWSRSLVVKALTEARFSSDGTTLWVGGVDGVFRSTGELTELEPLPDAVRISLAIEQAGELWLCGYYDGTHDGVARVDSSGVPHPIMAFADVTEHAACAQDAPSTLACGQLWRDWQREILGIFPDAGAAGSGPEPVDGGARADAAPEPSPPPEAEPRAASGCDCRATGAGRGDTPAAALACAVLLLALARLRVHGGRRARRLPRHERLCKAAGATQPGDSACAHSSS